MNTNAADVTEARFTGLTQAEVEERVRQGQTNEVPSKTSRSTWHIVRANVFNRFNAILGVLFVALMLSGAKLRDGLFGMVLVANAVIGVAQELRAKWTLDRLSLLSAPRTRVLREGRLEEIPQEEVVLDDIMELRTGDQVVADGEVLSAEGLEVDESFLTGESVPVVKKEGDEVLSGSFVVAGIGNCRATRVGADAYARKLASEAKQFKLASSDLRDGINLILRYITWVMIPAGLLLLYSQLKAAGTLNDLTVNNIKNTIPGVVAGLVGMVPEGLVLLTSMAFAVAAVTLARSKVLVQELQAVEGLARVDMVCVDKTGTLTEGSLVFGRMEALGAEESEVAAALGALGSRTPVRNATLEAVAAVFPPPPGNGWNLSASVPFSSARKWSSASFEDQGTWLMGAPEVMLTDSAENTQLLQRVSTIAAGGERVLLLAHAPGKLEEQVLPPGLEPVALLTLEEKVREDAPETMRYFAGQDVTIKVISGDNPTTVATVAERAGVAHVGLPVDARELPDDREKLADMLNEHTVFGRVVPHQKQDMVKALQGEGHIVAMTGDGVNDVLALKDADIGIAMGSGAPATKSVAQLVLLDGKFSHMPGVVAEGRRVIANMERVARLFLNKTVYATIMALFIGIVGWKYPFLPRHLTLVSIFTIGIPAFVLSFSPSKERYRPGFVKRVLWFAVPSGIITALMIIIIYTLARVAYPAFVGDVPPQAKTAATLVVSIMSLFVLAALARPLKSWRGWLVLAMALGMVLVLAVPFARNFYALDLPMPIIFFLAVGLAVDGILILEYTWRVIAWYQSRQPGAKP
jgi:cation-transporting ATPase E